MKFYAARHTHGTEFAYPDGWTAYVFPTKKDRDDFVHETNTEDSRSGHNQRSEPITRKIAQRIADDRTKEVDLQGYNGVRLERDDSYSTHYWS